MDNVARYHGLKKMKHIIPSGQSLKALELEGLIHAIH